MIRFLLGFLAAIVAIVLLIKFGGIGATEWLAGICKIKGDCNTLGGLI